MRAPRAPRARRLLPFTPVRLERAPWSRSVGDAPRRRRGGGDKRAAHRRFVGFRVLAARRRCRGYRAGAAPPRFCDQRPPPGRKRDCRGCPALSAPPRLAQAPPPSGALWPSHPRLRTATPRVQTGTAARSADVLWAILLPRTALLSPAEPLMLSSSTPPPSPPLPPFLPSPAAHFLSRRKPRSEAELDRLGGQNPARCGRCIGRAGARGLRPRKGVEAGA